ncbi:hypothetical protein DVH24_029043 [Malus domestica]|uniref:Uncharacterized protein n=1 Tax=Malus domestica TaxID=3750 RepID=A0A498HWD9_MALDO|nr:hypothetical protein DVH24_029043 [Malus domestica]
MSSAAVAGMMFQCVFEGSLSMQDTEIERRPYHKNCNCALHSKVGVCSNACQRNISFPKKQSWSDSSLRMQGLATSNSLLLSLSAQRTRLTNNKNIIKQTENAETATKP